MSHLALYLLGSPRIERDGAPIVIRRRKALALVAYLAVTGRDHSRDALATLFWPELDQSRARAGLRRELAVLRRALGADRLDVDREHAGLNRNADVWLDVDEFQAWLAACQTHDHPADQVCPDCLSPLAEAAALYHDDFLAGFTLRDSPDFDDWQFFQGEGLRTEMAGALRRLVLVHSERDEFEPAIAYARRWLALDPLHEPAHRHLMRLYAWSGQRAAALRQYQECERILQAELGVQPERETTKVYESIKAEQEGAPPATLLALCPTVHGHNLSIQPTPFIGREKALARIRTRLQDPACRLLTLVGPGGIGKTRLALEAAASQVDRFDGVYLISLVPLRSVEAIVPAVAKALGFCFHKEGEPREQLVDYFRRKRLLIILDSFEHLLEGVGLVTDILATAPGVKILSTSRTRLNVQGEHLFPVAGMEFPQLPQDSGPRSSKEAMQYSAIRLFLSSARQVQPDFVLTAENLPAIVRICHLVQGMPLAIVLAAAWVPVLSPAEIATEVSRSLDFLEADVRDVPERHRSLRAVFDHSWNLLPLWEQDALMQLSVFCGGFTRQAAQRVAGASLRELRALVSKSLLYRAAVPSAGPFDELRTGGRYEMHELVQQYAADKLERSPEAAHVVRDRHCAYFAAALQRWVEDLQGPRQRAALAERIVESENARLAWDWAVEQGHITRLGQALAGMSSFYQLQARYQEGEAACRIASEKLAAMAVAERQALSRGACSLACLRAQVLTWQSVFCQLLERTKLARQLLRQSLGLLNGPELTGHDTRAEKAFALLQAGILTEDSDRGQARRLFEQSLALYQAVGDQWGTANVLDRLGWLHRYTGTYDQAQKRFQEGLAIRRALGDRIGIADTLWGLCGVAMRQGKLELAERLARKSSAIYQTLGDRLANAVRFESLGDTLVDVGKFAEGRTVLEKSRTTFDDLGIRRGYAHAHVALSAANLHVGQYEQARALAHQGITLWQDLGLKGSTAFARYVLGNVALAQEAYAEAQELLQQTIVLYQACEPVSEVAWVLASMAVAAQGLGQVAQARQHLGTALRTATDIRSFLALVDVLPAVALFLTGQGEHERAVELYALASRYPRVANSQWFRDVAGNHVAAGAATLPPDVVVAAQSRGRERDLEAAVAELLVEFVKT